MKAKYVLKSDRVCRALTGLDVNGYNRLLENFIWMYDRQMRIEFKARCEAQDKKALSSGGSGSSGVGSVGSVRVVKHRSFGGGRIGAFGDDADKLLLVLFFLKTYSTEEVLAAFFGVDNSTAGIRLRKFRSVVVELLGESGVDVLPRRKISSLEELFEKFPEISEVYIDGTERPVQKKLNRKASNKNYSKKGKKHTRKNVTVVGKGKTGDRREILSLTPTRNGRRHDKKISDKDQIYRYLPPEIETYQDTGFIGSNKLNLHEDNSNFHIPKKKTKLQSLTDDDKFLNRLISSIRVTVENSNWGLKRLNSIAHIFRHKISRSDDQFMLLAAGIWNFHLLHNEIKMV